MLTYIRAVEKYLRHRKRAIKILAPMIFGLVFMVLCIINITRSLSPSEVHCANLVREEFPTVLKTALENKQSPVYILALKTWSHFLGHTDFAMRMLSVVCGALIVLLVYYIMRRIFGLRVALPAAFLTATSPLLVALGKDIPGKPILCDLGKMPHLLIAGSTGSGKSVCVNSILMSIIAKPFIITII